MDPVLHATLCWEHQGRRLEARPATQALVAQHSAALAGWYNVPANKALMANTQDFTAQEVEEMYAAFRADAGLVFLLFVDGALCGDADLRNVRRHSAEFAIMVGAPEQQGRGLGTAFTAMIHVHALRDLKLPQVWLSIVPDNVGARRCYEKCGYVVDHGPGASDVMEEPTDVPMRLTAADLQRCQPAAWTQVVVQR